MKGPAREPAASTGVTAGPVRGADPPPRLVVPWELQLATRLPLPPLLVGALVAATLVAAAFAFHWISGVPFRNPQDLFGLVDYTRNAIFNSVFLGYAIGSLGYGSASIQRDLRELGIAEEESSVGIDAAEARRSRLWGAAGVGMALLMLIVIQVNLGFPLSNLWSLELSWFVAVTLLLGWVVGRAARATIAGPPAALMQVTGREVDLLELRPLHVLGRIALRNALLFIIGISLFVPFALVPGYTSSFVVIMAAALVFPTLAFLLPLRGVRARIRAARRSELARIDAELRRARDAAERLPPGRLADLHAQRAYVVAVHEWPFDGSTLARFGLYLLIPLASWVGGALVERIVDAAIE